MIRNIFILVLISFVTRFVSEWLMKLEKDKADKERENLFAENLESVEDSEVDGGDGYEYENTDSSNDDNWGRFFFFDFDFLKN